MRIRGFQDSSVNQAVWLGKREYLETLELQDILFKKIMSGNQNNTLLLVEHNPIYTLGRGIFNVHGINKDDYLCVDRGGGLTYHGPGQLVCYPIINLGQEASDFKSYLNKLEEVVIRTMYELNIYGYRIQGATGVWAGGKKISSFGVKVVRGFTKHGFSINVNPDMNYFKVIEPCGINGDFYSSIYELTAMYIDIIELAQQVTSIFSDVFNRSFDFAHAKSA